MVIVVGEKKGVCGSSGKYYEGFSSGLALHSVDGAFEAVYCAPAKHISSLFGSSVVRHVNRFWLPA
jgi:hypothetical protein